MDWERTWAPYDDATYAAALAFLRPADVVLDIGAGDLRFARRAAARSAAVIAVEVNPGLHNPPYPPNLTVCAADARTWAFPAGVTAAVLLMRHCTQFHHYAAKLMAVDCTRLITNARWGMGVELIDLAGWRTPYAAFDGGWYACRCGAVGFKACDPGLIDAALLSACCEVIGCPACPA